MQHLHDLRQILSYKSDPKVIYFAKFGNYINYLIDKKGQYPTGLHYLVEEYLLKNNVSYSVVDLRKVPANKVDFKLDLKLTPYLEQEGAARACLNSKRGIVSMPTGTGKSLVAALIINKMKVKTLIVVPSLELKSQLSTFLASCFGEDMVGFERPIFVENVQALDPNDEVTNYDCLIIDEFHHSGAKTYQKLNKKAWNNIYYRFGLTATPWRNNAEERLLLESILSTVVFNLDIKRAISKGYIVPVEAYYVDLPKQRVGGHTWAQVYSELVVNNIERNKQIASFLLALQNQGKPSICLVKEIAHGSGILKHISSDNVIPFAHAQNPYVNEMIKGFNKGIWKAIIGTNGVLGEGIDTKPAEYIIVAGLGKAKGAFMQQVGRALRRYPSKQSAKVIIFRDPSHKWSLTHFNAQAKILKEEYGVIPTKLEI